MILSANNSYQIGVFSILSIGIAVGSFLAGVFIQAIKDFDFLFITIPAISVCILLYLSARKGIESYEKKLKEMN